MTREELADLLRNDVRGMADRGLFVRDDFGNPDELALQELARAVLAHLGEGREREEEIRRLTQERDQFEAERACSIHEGWKLVWCNECVRAQAAAHAEDMRKIQMTLLEVRETLLRWYRLDSKPSVNELGRLIDRVSEIVSPSAKGQQA